METRKISELNPWPDNPRKNDGMPVDDVVESLKIHGQKKRMIISAKGKPFEEETICCGHTLRKALIQFGSKTVNVDVVEFETEDDFADYAIRDNLTGEGADWWDTKLVDVGARLNVNLGEMGFDLKQIEKNLKSDIKKITENTESDDPKGTGEESSGDPGETPNESKVRTIKFGKHTLKCGEETKQGDIDHLIASWNEFTGVPVGEK